MFQPVRALRHPTLFSSLSKAFATTRMNPHQKFLVFFGAPGVGKGTYGGLLAKELQYNKISTGDEIRRIIKGQQASTMSADVVNEVKSIVKAGKLVGDDIVFAILEEKLKEPASQKGVILDGFPRTLEQLKKYDEKFPVDLVLNIELNNDILIEKLLGRRTCSGCGQSYNICSIHRDGYEMEPLLPKKEGHCDKCDGKLVLRDDDKREIIVTRMEEYNAKTFPLLDEYKKKGVLISFEAKRGVKDFPKIAQLVRGKLNI